MKMKIVYISIYNEDEYYDQFLNSQLEYIKNSNVTFFFITFKKLSSEFIIDGNILYINGVESMIPGILNKSIIAMDILTNKLNFEYDFLVRTSVHNIINFIQLEKYVMNLNLNKNYYIGPVNNLQWFDHQCGIIDNTYFGTEYCVGSFILMNKGLVINILENKDKLNYNLVDDLSIGVYVTQIVKPIDITELCSNKEYSFVFTDVIYNKICYFFNQNKQNRIIDINNLKTIVNILNNNKILINTTQINGTLPEISKTLSTDKNTTHSYLDLYESLLVHKKETSTNVLEIGIDRGGSILLWFNYFKNANVYALDIISESEIDDSLKNNDRIKLYHSTDAYDSSFFYETFQDNFGTFDMVLDDGPHTLESMIQFVKLYSKLLKDDGILILEDVQAPEWFDVLKDECPEELKKYIITYDLRFIKNRYDDLVFTIQKNL